MKLTERNTENLVRALASAGRDELDQCGRDLKALQVNGQPVRVIDTAGKLMRLTRALAKEL